MANARPASLDEIGFLKPLAPEQRAALVRQCRWRRFRAEEQLFDQHSDSCDVGFVVEGAVRVVNHAVNGRKVCFDDVAAGGFLGELAAIDGELRSASVVALEDTVVAFLAAKAFRALLVEHPPLAEAMMLRLTSIIRNSNDRIMDLSTLTANNRVHAELVRLGRQHLKDDNTAVIDPVPLQADIAARVSTTRETVARVLSDLARDNTVKRVGDKLIIHDFEALQSLVESVRGHWVPEPR